MKKKCRFLMLPILLLVGMMIGCELESVPHGDLYGYWHLEAVDTLSGGTTDVSDQRLFWAIQNQLVECSDRDNRHIPIVMHFERSGDSLLMDKVFVNDRPNGDPEVTDVGEISCYGLRSLKPHLHIDQLSDSKMVLSAEGLVLRFRKM